jgi:hypothetical protein
MRPLTGNNKVSGLSPPPWRPDCDGGRSSSQGHRHKFRPRRKSETGERCRPTPPPLGRMLERMSRPPPWRIRSVNTGLRAEVLQRPPPPPWGLANLAVVPSSSLGLPPFSLSGRSGDTKKATAIAMAFFVLQKQVVRTARHPPDLREQQIWQPDVWGRIFQIRQTACPLPPTPPGHSRIFGETPCPQPRMREGRLRL